MINIFKFYYQNNEIHLLNDELNTIYVLKHMELLCALANLNIAKNSKYVTMERAVQTIPHYNEKGQLDGNLTEFRFYPLEKSKGNCDVLNDELLKNYSAAVSFLISEFFRNGIDDDKLRKFVCDSHDALMYVGSYAEDIYDSERLLKGLANATATSFNVLKCAYDARILVADGTPHMVYYGDNYNHVYMFDLVTSLTNLVGGVFDPKINKCKNCDRFFIVDNRSDTKYCNNPAPQNNKYKCNDAQIRFLYGGTDIETEIKTVYRKINSSLTSRVKRHPFNKEYALKFDEFKRKSEEFKADIAKGRCREERYLDWLRGFNY